MLTVTRVNSELVVEWGDPDVVHVYKDIFSNNKEYVTCYHFLKSIDPNSALSDAVTCRIVDAHYDSRTDRWVVTETCQEIAEEEAPLDPERVVITSADLIKAIEEHKAGSKKSKKKDEPETLDGALD